MGENKQKKIPTNLKHGPFWKTEKYKLNTQEYILKMFPFNVFFFVNMSENLIKIDFLDENMFYKSNLHWYNACCDFTIFYICYYSAAPDTIGFIPGLDKQSGFVFETNERCIEGTRKFYFALRIQHRYVRVLLFFLLSLRSEILYPFYYF